MTLETLGKISFIIFLISVYLSTKVAPPQTPLFVDPKMIFLMALKHPKELCQRFHNNSTSV